MERPNILLIMADQLSAFALPSYGHPVVKAPHITGLAEEGVLFEHAYCNSPLCVPSQASMMTERLPSRSGATGCCRPTKHCRGSKRESRIGLSS